MFNFTFAPNFDNLYQMRVEVEVRVELIEIRYISSRHIFDFYCEMEFLKEIDSFIWCSEQPRKIRCECLYTYTHPHMHTSMHTRSRRTCTCQCTHAQDAHAHANAHTLTCICTCQCTHTHMHMHTHSCMHTLTHSLTHTHTPTLPPPPTYPLHPFTHTHTHFQRGSLQLVILLKQESKISKTATLHVPYNFSTVLCAVSN